MKKLGFGLMRLPVTNPDDAASIDEARLNEMVDTFLAKGLPISTRPIPTTRG